MTKTQICIALAIGWLSQTTFVYKIFGTEMPVDLKCFIDKNKALSLEDYVEENKKNSSHKHNLAVLDWFTDHLLGDYILDNKIKIEDNQKCSYSLRILSIK